MLHSIQLVCIAGFKGHYLKNWFHNYVFFHKCNFFILFFLLQQKVALFIVKVFVLSASGVARNFQCGKEVGGRLWAETPVPGNFCNLLIKITHFYAYFGQNTYFEAITH